MAFSNLFRRYSTSNETHSTLYTYTDRNAIAETLLDELESQCRNCLTTISQNSHMLNSSTGGSYLSTYNSSLNILPPTIAKRHSSVDYSWLTPNNNLFQTTNETYHLSDIIKMELSELIRNVLAEDCTLIINQFRRQIRVQTKLSTPENIIALFRKTIADYIDKKSQNRSSTTNLNDGNNSNTKHNNNNNNKTSSGLYSFVRNNRVNPKHQSDDKQHCIAELTEISITSSSNDGTDSTKIRSNSHS
ncbi:unnamed protein product [Adineta steineri]|uniref:Uncharacterized protein n=1 Tax=Adineta steineri TaxID=433720 RepID=A0A818Z8T4_9BILA|nr:unnamed protein product [Adineta steineri]